MTVVFDVLGRYIFDNDRLTLGTSERAGDHTLSSDLASGPGPPALRVSEPLGYPGPSVRGASGGSPPVAAHVWEMPIDLLRGMRQKALAAVLVAAFVGATTAAEAGNVAVVVSADVDAYREAIRGFKAGLRHRVVAEYDMEGNFDLGRKIVAEIQSKVKPDLILAVGIWALQVLAGQSPGIPVVYAMVLNPPSVVGPELRNVTGASMNVPVEGPLRIAKELGPQIRRVGVVFDRSKTGYLVRRAEAVAREEGLQLIAKEIRSAREAIQALDALQEERVDVLWILPDDTTLTKAVVQQMLLFSYRKKIPLIGLSESQAQEGALLALSFASSEDIGQQAAELANSILAGRTPGEIPYTTARRVHLTVNLKAAQKLGIEIPKTILAMANTVIQR